MNPSIDLVPINHALTLRNHGFAENTDYTYYRLPDGDIKPHLIHYPENIIVVRAPYFQEVFRWFRVNHNIDKCIDHMVVEGSADTQKRYFYQITIKHKGLFINSIYVQDMYETYENAELACLEKLIEIISG